MSMDSICVLWRHVCALGTWYMLSGHGICSMDMSSCWRRIYGVFLLERNIWIWKMSSCCIRVYGYGRCILVGEEYMAMEDVFLLEKNICDICIIGSSLSDIMKTLVSQFRRDLSEPLVDTSSSLECFEIEENTFKTVWNNVLHIYIYYHIYIYIYIFFF